MHNGPKERQAGTKSSRRKKKGSRRKEAARPLKEGLVTGVDEPCVTQI